VYRFVVGKLGCQTRSAMNEQHTEQVHRVISARKRDNISADYFHFRGAQRVLTS
jgi:hypothetical protein